MYYLEEMPAVVALIPLAIGVISCFWGYRLFRVILGIIGFIMGGFLAGSFAFGLSGGSVVVTVIASIVGAIVGGLLVSVVYYIGVFLLGALGGWMLGGIVAGMSGQATALVAGIVLAVLGGILALVFQRIIIIAATACVGSWNVISALYVLSTGTLYSPLVFWRPGRLLHLSGARFFFVLAIWLVLSLAGIVFQIRFGKREHLTRGTSP
jgi:hypothetical protein